MLRMLSPRSATKSSAVSLRNCHTTLWGDSSLRIHFEKQGNCRYEILPIADTTGHSRLCFSKHHWSVLLFRHAIALQVLRMDHAKRKCVSAQTPMSDLSPKWRT
jgi:hypothetical protein